ncbi:uncharacterized protein EV154DRAFT_480721 [Mucor mucedo]|uniref:uncharacterized protein n=1 Tax=Mucor mucedo TaxID=29922 RepID=UPI00221E9D13|nr:uncharacterized protein EV154DRAFT_480721 [Mucor mucedo]KAI7892111.1 hypothetical protein EV154DRAFT_480721 [Mucor mucedo]
MTFVTKSVYEIMTDMFDFPNYWFSRLCLTGIRFEITVLKIGCPLCETPKRKVCVLNRISIYFMSKYFAINFVICYIRSHFANISNFLTGININHKRSKIFSVATTLMIPYVFPALAICAQCCNCDGLSTDHLEILQHLVDISELSVLAIISDYCYSSKEFCDLVFGIWYLVFGIWQIGRQYMLHASLPVISKCNLIINTVRIPLRNTIT